MKDLLDELKKLGDEDYKVSPNFSKNVMKEIKKQNRNKKIIYVTSIASVACVLGISILFVNRSGLLIKNSSYEVTERAESLSSSYPTSDKEIESTNGSAMIYDTVDNVQEESITEDSLKVLPASNEKLRDYTKKNTNREQLEQIMDALKLHDFDIQDKDTEIIVYSKNVAEVLDVVEKFENTEVGMSGENIVVKLKE